MADANIKTRLSLDADFTNANSSLRVLSKNVNLTAAAFNSMSVAAQRAKMAATKDFVASLGTIGGYRTSFVELATATDQFGKALARNKLTLREYYREAGRAYTKQASLAKRLAYEQVKLMQSTTIGLGGQGGRGQGMVITPKWIDDNVTTKMQLASKQWSIFNALVQGGAQKLIDWGKNTQWAGRQLTVGLTVPLTIFAATASKAFRDVDKELTRLQKVYGSDLVTSNAQATAKIRQQVEEVATAFAQNYGIAAKETAALAADLAATGLEGQKLIDSVSQTTRLAVLGEVDRQQAMQATLSIQSAFKLNTEELADSINFLNAVENQTTTSLDDLTTAIPKAGPVVRALGGDIKDLAAMLTAMREGGIPAAEAANAIKSGLASMINPTQKASDVAKKFGVDLEGIVAANRGQLMPTLQSLQGALEKIDSFGRAQIIEEIFGKYQFARISALFDNIGKSGSQTEKVFELMGKSSKDLADIANSEIKTLTESASMRWQRAMESIKVALLPVGEILTNMLIPVLQKGADAITTITDAFNNMPEGLKSGIKLIGTLVAVAGPLIMMAGIMGNFLGYTQKGVMGIVNLSRKILGLPTEKFELLDAEQVAAAQATDILSNSFDRQKTSLSELNTLLAQYQRRLGQIAAQNPNFITKGATIPPVPRIKKANGGGISGYGGGDIVPALLEPGEFVVRKEQAKKYAPLLRSINSGSVRGYVDGDFVTPFDPNRLGFSKDLFFDPRTIPGAKEDYWARSHFAGPDFKLGERKPFAGISQAESQDLNQMYKTLGIKGPVTFDELTGAYRKMLDDAAEKKVKPGPAAEYLKREIKAVVQQTPNKEGRNATYQRRLAQRAALTELTLLPNSLFGSVYDKEKYARAAAEDIFQRIYAAKDPGAIRDALYERARTTIVGDRPLIEYGVSKETSSSAGVRNPAVPLHATTGSITGMDVLDRKTRKKLAGIPEGTTPIAVGRGTAETMIPQAYLADNGAYVDKNGRVSSLKQGMMRRSGTMMNAGFMAMMALPMLGQMNDGMAEATDKLTMLAAAASMAGMAMQLMSGMPRLGGAGRGFLGLKAAGNALQRGGRNVFLSGQSKAAAAGLAARSSQYGIMNPTQALAASKTAANASRIGLGARVGSSALLTGGRFISMLGGPVGIAVGLGITAAVIAWGKYQESVENAKASTRAALETSQKLAESFGIEAKSAAEGVDRIKASLDALRGDTSVQNAVTLSDQMKSQVTEDYQTLIEKLKVLGTETAGNELVAAYSSMIMRGFGPDQAKAIVEEIARQAQKTEVVLSIKAELTGINTPEQAMKAQEEYIKAQANIPNIIGELQKQESQVSSKMQEIIKGKEGFDIFGFTTAAEEYRKAVKEGLPTDQFAQDVKVYGDLANQSERLTQEMNSLRKSATYSEELIAPAIKNIMGAFATDPSLAIQGMNSLVDSIVAVTDNDERFRKLQAASTEMQAQLVSIGADPATIQVFTNLASKSETAEQAMTVFNATLMSVPGIAKMAADGLSETELFIIKNATASNMAALEISNLANAYGQLAKTELQELQQVQGMVTQGIDSRITKLNEQSKAVQENAQESADAIAKENDALQEQQKDIQENTDARTKLIDKQIESLQKAKEQASFDEQQRQRGIGALSALAQGDIAGFITAQSQMAAESEQRNKDLAIQALEDRKKAIQEESDARVKAIQDQIDANDKLSQSIQDGVKASQKAIEKQIFNLERRKAQINDILSGPQKLFDQIMQDGMITEEEQKQFSKSIQDALIKAGDALGPGFDSLKTQLASAMQTVGNSLTTEYGKLLDAIFQQMADTLGIDKDVAERVLRSEFRRISSAQTMNAYSKEEERMLANRYGARASGGYVARGQGYIVGERGPEYFQPFQSGMITPNSRMPRFANGGLATSNPFYSFFGSAAGNFARRINRSNIDAKGIEANFPILGKEGASSISSFLKSMFDKLDPLPYIAGSSDPLKGFDCSGFTSYVLSKAGIKTAAYSPSQMADSKFGTIKPGQQLQVGDLLFWGDPTLSGRLARSPGQPNHVGFYYGNNRILHSTGGGVQVSPWTDGWYKKYYLGARRPNWPMAGKDIPAYLPITGGGEGGDAPGQGSPFSIGFAVGGRVSGRGSGTSDSIPAMLSNGEYVIKASSAASLGTNTLDYMNQRGKMPGFAMGGQIGPAFTAPSAPSANVSGSGSGAVYNINVTVNGTNAGADEIANKVFAKARQRENARSLKR